VNVADSALVGPNYCKRLEKYAARGFAIAVPGYDPELVSAKLSQGTFVHLCKYDMVLQLAPRFPNASLIDSEVSRRVVSEAKRRVRASAVQRATVVNNMQRLVVLDGRGSVRHILPEERCDALTCTPVSAGVRGEYLLLWGIRLEDSDLSDDEEGGLSDDSGETGPFYTQAPLTAVQAILEKAFRSDLSADGGHAPECDDGWWHGGVMERLASRMKGRRGTAAIAAATEDQLTRLRRQAPLLFVYDVIDCSGGFASLRFVCDAQRPPLMQLASPTESFEEVFGLPRSLLFVPGEERGPFPLDWWGGIY
jgi:hypothetical protein